MRYNTEIIQKAVIELLTQMQKTASATKMKLALDSGISRQHLGLVAKGKRGLSVKSFCDLADAFGCSATDFMAKLEALMQEQLASRAMTADKSKGLDYIQKSILKNL